MKIYANSINVDFKEDGSPVTLADKAAEHVILNKLKEITPDILIMSQKKTLAVIVQKLRISFFSLIHLMALKNSLKKMA